MLALFAPQVDLYSSEAALLGALGGAVAAADPDVLLGYEVQRSSLGYAVERAAALGLPSLLRAMSRLPRVS
jgi:DNA polymerase zeta